MLGKGGLREASDGDMCARERNKVHQLWAEGTVSMKALKCFELGKEATMKSTEGRTGRVGTGRERAIDHTGSCTLWRGLAFFPRSAFGQRVTGIESVLCHLI